MPIAAVGNVVRGGNRVRIGGVSLPIGLILLRGQIRAQAAERHAQERVVTDVGGGFENQHGGVVVQPGGSEAADDLRAGRLVAEQIDGLFGVLPHGGRVDEKRGQAHRKAERYGQKQRQRAANGVYFQHLPLPSVSASAGRGRAWRRASARRACGAAHPPARRNSRRSPRGAVSAGNIRRAHS